MELIAYNLHQFDAGWSSLVARRAHNPKVVGSNPAPATNFKMVVLDRVPGRAQLSIGAAAEGRWC